MTFKNFKKIHMFTTKKPVKFTINPKEPLPKDPADNSDSQHRPPPMVYCPNREYNGQTPRAIKKMMEERKKYQEQCEMIQTKYEIDVFEKRQKGQIKRNERDPPPPAFPQKPKADNDVLNTFEMPSSTKFYDYQCPKYKKNENNKNYYKKDEEDLPIQIANTLWNILDEPTLPSGKEFLKKKYYNHRPFITGKLPSHDGKIPLMSDELKRSAKINQIKTQNIVETEAQKIKDFEIQTIHERILADRKTKKQITINRKIKNKMYKQNWSAYRSRLRKIDQKKMEDYRRYVKGKGNKDPVSKEDMEALAELAKYDDEIYENSKKMKKDPSPEYIFLMQQMGYVNL